MITVVDASAAVEIALYREKAQLFKAALAESEIVITPDLYISEVTKRSLILSGNIENSQEFQIVTVSRQFNCVLK